MFMRDDLVTAALPPAFAEPELRHDWRSICETIGERRAGTVEEQRAAEFIAQRFHAAGIGEVQIEPFPCNSLRRATVEVYEKAGHAWQPVEARALVGSPSTPDRRPVEGEVVWL